MNADAAQMNVPQATSRFEAAGSTKFHLVLQYVHLRCICVHLRFQSLFVPSAIE